MRQLKVLYIMAMVLVTAMVTSGHTAVLMQTKDALSQGLVAYWTFNEGEGDIVFDQTANGNDGTIHGASWVPGKFGTGLKFAESDDVTIPFDPSLEPENVSISLWIYPTPAQNKVYGVIRKDHGYHNGWRILYDYRHGGQMCSQVNFGDDDPLMIWSKAKFANRWVHFVWTYDKQQVKVYINGTLDSFYEEDRSINYKQTGLLMGNPPGGFQGFIDDVRIYNRPLTEEEIELLYAQGVEE